MIFPEIERKAYDFYPAILLDQVNSHHFRNWLRTVLLWILLALMVLFAIELVVKIPVVDDYIYQIRGVFLLVFTFWLGGWLLEAMYFSYYFKDTDIDFAVADLALNTNPHDVTGSFLRSRIGQYTMLRLGIPAKELAIFLKTRTDFVTTAEYMAVPDEKSDYLSIAEYGRALTHFDNDFKKFLARHAVTPDMFRYALRWVAKNQRKAREYERWWSRENLARIPSVGRNWSFGQVFLLEKFGHPIFYEDTYAHLGDKWRLQKDTVLRLEQILLKESGANVMLVCDDDAAGMEVVASLAKNIVQGTALPELESKRMFVLDGTALIDAMHDKIEIERTFREVLYEAARAGNVILVIPRFGRFAESALTVGSDVESMLSEALGATNLQVIALAGVRRFHATVEPNHNLMRQFEKIMVHGFDEFQTVAVLEDEANFLERKYRIFFTYQSLLAIADSADRYFADGSVRDKAVAILHELVPIAVQSDHTLITKDDVLALVEQKTGIPQGEVKEGERDKLDHLEDVLHERIVGQEAAITALASALRRARAGLTNPKRPMGSFLFLGPTGVGKTETTKALAETYFGDEEAIIRLDMSEYTSFDALHKLIGNAEGGEPGILSSRIREKQYGVLLLDEFEKTTKEVRDLFLQVLDEGFFSDGRGEKVNARNLIIVATSNAGSDLIYAATERGVDISQKKDEVVNALIVEGIFKPELVNRFDEVIVFHPLGEEHLAGVAARILDRLNARMEKSGITIKSTESLVRHLVASSKNPQFGAREMNRIVQDTIEKLIAEGIIDGNIKTGDSVEIIVTNGTLSVKAA